VSLLGFGGYLERVWCDEEVERWSAKMFCEFEGRDENSKGAS
jgi:hypothetical protein